MQLPVSLGYESWQVYKLNKIRESQAIISNKHDRHEPTLTNRKQTRKSSYKRYFLLGGLTVFATLGLLAILKFRKPGLGNTASAKFSARKTTSNDLPNTVVFSYNIDDVNADSFFIQQSWDRNRRVRIYKNSYTLTDIYYEPGYHKAKLIANDQIIKTVDVSIPTDRWFFYAKEKAPKSLPKYIQAGTGIHKRFATIITAGDS